MTASQAVDVNGVTFPADAEERPAATTRPAGRRADREQPTVADREQPTVADGEQPAHAGGAARPEPLIKLERIARVYDTGRVQVAALSDVDLVIERGEFVAIVGPSGSGKSTLMHILGCLDRPTSGEYALDGASVAALGDDRLAEVRSREIGFVFQSYNLLPRTSALDNVAAPLVYQGVGRRERMERSKAALERLGLGDRLDHEPTQLSGGQQQRVALARAIVTDPALILADEPTGNLDSASGAEVMDLLRELHAGGHTIVLITHDTAIAAHADRQIHVLDGRLAA